MFLGEGNLFDKIEPMPNETVLWSGKADVRGFFCNIAESFIGIILVVSFFAFMFSFKIIFFEKVENPTYSIEKEAYDKAQADQNMNGKKGSERNRIEPPKRFIEVFSKKRFTIFVVFVCSIFLIWLYFVFMATKKSFYLITNERIIIQKGYFNKSITAIDLDKVAAVVSSQSIFQKIFKLHSIKLANAGVEFHNQNNFAKNSSNSIDDILIGENITSKLLNTWLPRDNK